jgi:sorting nexin-1/2
LFTQLIEIWETFLMQLDTEDGETFVPPAGVVASPTSEASAPAATRLPEIGSSEDADLTPAIESTTEPEE